MLDSVNSRRFGNNPFISRMFQPLGQNQTFTLLLHSVFIYYVFNLPIKCMYSCPPCKWVTFASWTDLRTRHCNFEYCKSLRSERSETSFESKPFHFAINGLNIRNMKSEKLRRGPTWKMCHFWDFCTGQGLVPNHRQLYITVKVFNQGF